VWCFGVVVSWLIEFWLLLELLPLVVWLIPATEKKIAKSNKITVFIKDFLRF
jgi:hypothetical protein